MKKMKKFIVLNAGVLILASMLVYPIFAKDGVVGEKSAITQEEYQAEEKSIVGKGNALYKTIRSTNSQSRLTVGQEFTDKIYNNGSKEEVVYEESIKEMFSFDKRELQVEDTSITIKYGEKTVEQEIRVIANNPEKSVLEQTSGEDKEKNPNTGDNMEIGKYCLIGGIGLLVIVGSIKRRKENK